MQVMHLYKCTRKFLTHNSCKLLSHNTHLSDRTSHTPIENIDLSANASGALSLRPPRSLQTALRK